jgi:preprotein translocase subunit SecY
MKKFIETLNNIWKIEELRARILYTLAIVLVYRLGTFIILPGIDPLMLGQLKRQVSGGILGILDMFSGGAFSNASVFALGVMPYISASIVMQLLGMAVPFYQRLQKEGESGRRKMNQHTRYLTVGILLLQAPSYLANLHATIPPEAFRGGYWFDITGALLLTAGTVFIMWLGERVTEKGIGNGISLLIMIGIIARLPLALMEEFGSRLEQKGGGLVVLLVEIIVLFIVFAATIMLIQGTRRIPVQYAKRIVGNKQYGGVRQYIPLKVNAAGVMPIIFAQALMFIPITIAGFAKSESLTGFVSAFSQITGFWYNFVFGLLIIVFTYFYTAITVNPNQMAEDMKKNGGFIPGVKPGRKTSEFIDSVMSKITLPGSIFLALVAILPAFAMLAGMTSRFAHFYGGTSLLIMVGVILDTLQQIESHLLMRHYDGLMKTGRIKGRSSGGY